jgi:hypothetical protein
VREKEGEGEGQEKDDEQEKDRGVEKTQRGSTRDGSSDDRER